MNQKDERTWGVLVHIAGFLGLTVIPMAGNIICVLILWLIKRNESPFVDDQGKESINFQITVSIVLTIVKVINGISIGLWSLAHFWSNGLFGWGWGWGWNSLYNIVWVINVIFCCIAAVKANNGEHYRYPVNLRLVK
ncbi:MAG TPA: DUF4870 domain-containing protein [Chitinophaga sp.]|uniref:DUF4870 domain-containing protein n=1 Tax=Chitinophaga sp. TaxID=1869181 RepID=UPI002CCEA584|nr:DUF4870 domain-containing protein [Chitinophaga sp.]HVI44866.1 DUF4870 domain-containing protein [Chitinophaga sp.]